MEWFKKILEGATLTEDGSLNVEAVMTAIQKEFPLHAVPKNVFNDKVEELKIANNTITDLKKNNTDNETLQTTIKEHEKTIEKLQLDAANTTKTYALKEQLSKAGVLDPDYLIYKQGGIEKFNYDKEGKPIGIEDILKPLRDDKAMVHLFQTRKDGTDYTPAGGGSYSGKNPFAKDTYNLTEQGKLLRENPAQAKELAAAAGYKL